MRLPGTPMLLVSIVVATWRIHVVTSLVDPKEEVTTMRLSTQFSRVDDREKKRKSVLRDCGDGGCGRRSGRNLRLAEKRNQGRHREQPGWNSPFRFVIPGFDSADDDNYLSSQEQVEGEFKEGGDVSDPADTESEDDIHIGAAIINLASGEEQDSSIENYHPSSYLATTWTFQHTIMDIDATSTESQDEEEQVMGFVPSVKDQESPIAPDLDPQYSYPWLLNQASMVLNETIDDEATIYFDTQEPETAVPDVSAMTDTYTRDTTTASCVPPLSARDRRLQLETLITQSITPTDVLYDAASAQNAAFHWLVYDDPAVVCPEATKDVIQRYVLAVLHFSMGEWDPACDQEQCDEDPFLSRSNVCAWEHVICPRGSETVVALALENTNAIGFLPLEVSNFGVLHSLTISGNSGLRGKIPVSYGNFGVVKNLNLHDNALWGEVPSQLCKLITLETLNVAGNQLSGRVPACLGTPGNLLSIDLSRNFLSGAIPSSIFDSIGCHTLHLHNNRLNGTIPEEIGSLSPAVDISFHRNQLSGRLPSSIQSLQNLRTLSLYGNEMTGPIPSQLGQLGQLERIFLHDNDFSGSMPESICNLRLDRGGSLAHLTADCGKAGKVACDCCTACF